MNKNMNAIRLHKTANVAGVVITLRQAGFTAYAETDRACNCEFLVTDASRAQAVLAFGHSNWIGGPKEIAKGVVEFEDGTIRCNI